MGKKVYLPVQKNKQEYRLYMDDIKIIHKISKKTRPALPSYDCEAKQKKWEELT